MITDEFLFQVNRGDIPSYLWENWGAQHNQDVLKRAGGAKRHQVWSVAFLSLLVFMGVLTFFFCVVMNFRGPRYSGVEIAIVGCAIVFVISSSALLYNVIRMFLDARVVLAFMKDVDSLKKRLRIGKTSELGEKFAQSKVLHEHILQIGGQMVAVLRNTNMTYGEFCHTTVERKKATEEELSFYYQKFMIGREDINEYCTEFDVRPVFISYAQRQAATSTKPDEPSQASSA